MSHTGLGDIFNSKAIKIRREDLVEKPLHNKGIVIAIIQCFILIFILISYKIKYCWNESFIFFAIINSTQKTNRHIYVM